ncbi:hypothetical protein BaRGS_00014620, partial [Batillaria attramentaria]
DSNPRCALRSAASNPVGARYLFFFNHDVESNRNTPAPGTRHGNELQYLFDPPSPLSALDQRLSASYVGFLADFVKSG